MANIKNTGNRPETCHYPRDQLSKKCDSNTRETPWTAFAAEGVHEKLGLHQSRYLLMKARVRVNGEGTMEFKCAWPINLFECMSLRPGFDHPLTVDPYRLCLLLEYLTVCRKPLSWRHKKWRLIDVSGVHAVNSFPDCPTERLEVTLNIIRRTLWLYASEPLMLLSLLMVKMIANRTPLIKRLKTSKMFRSEVRCFYGREAYPMQDWLKSRDACRFGIKPQFTGTQTDMPNKERSLVQPV
ncbi:hypothetical protein CLF_111642 [Clonorchis sinensis]|uniref:Uncharacterized protein n=1 Tax=Clonorchis sinensis TaxID=79923 RepID=G7YLU7_CLOSI|nr:hypothetical protein CLF_111642 [Clonorchis sinensis]